MKEISITGAELSTLCRLCLSSGVAQIDLFSIKMNRTAELIMKCATVQITRDDELPNFICQPCYTQLERIHQFLTQIELSDRTLRRYIKQLYASNKPIKGECSVQPSKNNLILNTNNDISKCDSLERANFIQENKNNGELYIKSEIIDEPMDDNLLIPTECAAGKEDTSSNVGGNKFSCEDSKIDTGETKVNEDTIVNWNNNEQANYILENTFMEEIYLKSEINDEPMDDSLPTDGAEGTSFNIDGNKINCEDSKFGSETKVSEDTIVNWKEKEPANYSLANKIEELKSEIVDEQKDDNLLSRTETDSINASFNGDGSEISCEDTKMNICHTSENFVSFRSVYVPENTEQCEETNKNTSIDSKKYKKSDKMKFNQCQFCDKCFCRPSYLNTHKLQHIGEKPFQKPYQCNVCNKGFNYKSNLNRHKSIHIDDKRFKCNVCNKYFTQSSSLSTHKLKHTGEKPYKCNVCDMCFSRSTYLNAHKRKHTGEKPYKCTVCDKCYSQLPHLKRHKLKHTGEKPYKCNVCDKCFTQSSDLNRHQFQHTRAVSITQKK